MNILDQLDAAEKAATQGEWLIQEEQPWRILDKGHWIGSCVSGNYSYGMTSRCNNARLIVEMRNNLRNLIEVARAAEKIVNHRLNRSAIDSPMFGVSPGSLWTIMKEMDEALNKLRGE